MKLVLLLNPRLSGRGVTGADLVLLRIREGLQGGSFVHFFRRALLKMDCTS